jgi:hypothetical protein
MASLGTLGHLLLGATIGLILGFLVSLAIPGPQPWLLVGGLVLGGFIAVQRRKFR